MALAIEFYAGVDAFMRVLSKMLIESGTLNAIVRQWKPQSAPAR